MSVLGVIADDLTGAMDAGLQFKGIGTRSVVHLKDAEVGHSETVVFDTESRAASPATAYARVRAVARRLRSRILYKKIDSTLRGNIGEELDAVMDELEFQRALITPAFPVNGRSVRQGYLLIEGTPLRQTDFVRDPLCPTTDHVPTLVASQSRRTIRHIGLNIVGGGAAVLADEIERSSAELVVIDASEEQHLLTIAQVARLLGKGCLTCGSAGLAGALPAGFGMKIQGRPRASAWRLGAPSRPVLVIAGSRRRATMRQIEEASRVLQAEVVEVDPRHLEESAERAFALAESALNAERDVIMTSAFRDYVSEMSKKVTRILGDLAGRLVRSSHTSRMVLTGGSTAYAVCQALGIDRIEIQEEIAPGIPAGKGSGDQRSEIGLVTKAGGFGEEDALIEAVRYLRGDDD